MLSLLVAATLFNPFPLPKGSYLQDVTMTANGQTMYVNRVDTNGAHTILVTTKTNGQWGSPRVASFSGHWRDLEETLSPDGNTMIFSSNRPVDGGAKPIDAYYHKAYAPKRGGNLWVTHWSNGGWSQPTRLPDGINANTSTFSPAIARDGTLVFMRASGANGSFHLFISKPENGEYRTSAPAPFGDDRYADADPTIAPDGSFVIFTSTRPPAERKDPALFISFNANGSWSEPKSMGREIDPVGDAWEARLSPDAKTLYYSRAAGIMSTDISEWMPPKPTAFAPNITKGALTPSFSPDGSAILFTKQVDQKAVIYESHLNDGAWSAPTIAPFSGTYSDMDAVYSPDGNYVIFASLRPAPGVQGNHAQLWRVAHTATGWGEPVYLPANVNVSDFVFAPSIAQDGTLYFLRSNKDHQHLLMSSRLVGDTYEQAQALPFSAPATNDFDPNPAPDQRFVIFASKGRGGSDTTEHLYIVFARDGSFTQPVRIRYAGDDAKIDDGSPLLGRDGKTLYFSHGDDILAIPLDGVLTSSA